MYIAHGQTVILIDPARFGPGLPPAPPPSPELIAQLKTMPLKMPDGEPNPETTVSAFPLIPAQMARFSGLKAPTLILVTDLHDDHLDPRVIAALKGASHEADRAACRRVETARCAGGGGDGQR